MKNYSFTNTWFDECAKGVWEQLIAQIKPKRILEIGSYEGASACYLIDKLSPHYDLEIHCIDTWEGGIEHKEGGFDMAGAEARFKHNIDLAVAQTDFPVSLTVHKGFSDFHLAKLFVDGKQNYFDFIYIDGSHQAADVLSDAVLGFKLLKIGGVMAFDDYNWFENHPIGARNLFRYPKPAIDAFVNLNLNKLNIFNAPLYQLYIQKLSD